MGQNRSPPKKVVTSLRNVTLVKHVSVSRPRGGGTKRGTGAESATPSSSPMGKRQQSLRSWRFGRSPMIQDLSTRTFGFPEVEGLKSLCEMLGVLLNVWHEAKCLKMMYSELSEACEYGEITEVRPQSRAVLNSVGWVFQRTRSHLTSGSNPSSRDFCSNLGHRYFRPTKEYARLAAAREW